MKEDSLELLYSFSLSNPFALSLKESVIKPLDQGNISWMCCGIYDSKIFSSLLIIPEICEIKSLIFSMRFQ